MGVPGRTVRTAASQWRDVAAYESIVRRMLEAVSDPVTVGSDGQPLGDDALVPRETVIEDVVEALRSVDAAWIAEKSRRDGEPERTADNLAQWILDREARR